MISLIKQSTLSPNYQVYFPQTMVVFDLGTETTITDISLDVNNNASDSCTITLKISSLLQNSISALYSSLQCVTDGTVLSFSDLRLTDTIKGAYLISRLPVKIPSLYTILNKTVRGSISLTAVHMDTSTKTPIFRITSLSVI